MDNNQVTNNAIGRRKASVARVYLTEVAQAGTGKITINGKDYENYMPVKHLRDKIVAPFQITETEGLYDATINVNGGGIKGQSEAIRLGIARALIIFDPERKPALKKEGFVTRDARKVERKKPGLRKARKREQYSKR